MSPRSGTFGVFVLATAIRRHVNLQAQARQLKETARENGRRSVTLTRPPDLRQSALRDLAQGRTNRALFIEAMADPLRRGIAFDLVERNCRERFAEGEDGIMLYRQLLGLVRLGNVSEAVEEFEHRFEPMLDQVLWKPPGFLTGPRRGGQITE